MNNEVCLFIVGPTASGKTELSLILAESWKSEIISADSRQIYRHIPIATASPEDIDLKKTKHYFIQERELDNIFNAGEFGLKAMQIIEEMHSKSKIPIIAGGSGLYIKFVVDGFFADKSRDDNIRNKLNDELIYFGEDYLFNKLKSIDPESVKNISPKYHRRIIRALELFYVSGKTKSELKNENIKTKLLPVLYAFDWDRKILYDHINERVEVMFDKGLLDEIIKIKEKGFTYEKTNSLNTVGVKEVFDYLDNKINFENMKELIKQNTRRYAKRQLTWFKKDKRINWLKINTKNEIISYAELINEDIQKLIVNNER